MEGPVSNPIVHLELRTRNLARACAFYEELFGWQVECVKFGGRSYIAVDLAESVGGGVAEVENEEGAWLPYVEVPNVSEATDRALLLGAEVRLAPREGPAGWRSVLEVPSGGEVALWQPKR